MGDAIEHAVLTAQSPAISAVTNAKGQTDVSRFEGELQILIQSLGYQSVTVSYEQLKQSNFVIRLVPTNLNLDAAVISASRWRQNSANIPSRIVTISPKEVAFQNPQTAADLLQVSGKVFIQKSQQGGGSPMIRGFATNRLVYTVDGVRMNTAIFRGGNIQNVINLDPFALENTEVFFGPGSVIYGSDAIGGVMSFQTLVPELAIDNNVFITGKALTRASSANSEQTMHVDMNVGWKKWGLVTSFSSWDFNHLRQGSNGPDDYLKDYYVQRQDTMDVVIKQDDALLQIPTGYTQTNLMQKVRFKPNEHWDFQYGFHLSETSDYGRYDRHNRVRKGAARYSEWNYGPQKWMMHNLNVTHSSATKLYDQLTLRLAKQDFEESRISRDLNNPDREIRVEQVDALSANLDVTKTLGNKHHVFYGAEVVTNEVTSTGTDQNAWDGTSSVGASRYPNATWTSMAVYLSDEYLVNAKTTLHAGLRYNQFGMEADFSHNLAFYPFPFAETEFNDGALTGSLGAVFRPNSTTVIQVNLGTAFRSPNVDDIGKVFDSEAGSVVVPNPALEAEYAYSADLGITKVFGQRIKLDLTGYYTLLNNALVRRDFQLNGMDSIDYDGTMSQVQAIQNAAVANVYGLQAGIEIKLPAGFSLSSDFNYQIGEEELDDGTTSPSRHAAPMFGISRLTYRANKLTFQVYSAYQGSRSHEDLAEEEKGKDEIYALDEDGETYAPSWYTLNLKAMYSLTDRLAVSGGVENITDQRYRPYSSGISGAGRNVILSLKATF
ncbi:MAG: TonB-dependent receptor [Bacteroidetes bacterium]|nr:TonB-dependent receptor [Bacteroidota bacterium]